MASGRGKSLHAKWLRKQIQLATKKAAKADASDLEHRNALKRLVRLEGELGRMHARPAKAKKKRSGSKKRKR